MSDLFLIPAEQIARMQPFFPRPRGNPRKDDQLVISGIVHVLRKGLEWQDAPAAYGPHKTLYNRYARWSAKGIFQKILATLAAEAGPPEQLMIDATHLKAHRTAASLHKKGHCRAVSGAPRAA